MTSLARAITAGVVLTVAASTAFVSPGIADPRRGERSLRQAVTVAGITDHQAALQRIANANKFLGTPTRATGTPGHERSVHYVVRTLRAAGLEVSLQPFLVDIFDERSPAVFERVSPDPVTYERFDGDQGVWYTADFSGSDDVTAKAEAIDFTEPTATANTSTSGCEPSDFDAGVVGKVALLQRGTCEFGLKVQNAEVAGAVGAVIFNEGTTGDEERNGVLIPTLENYDVSIPAVGTDYATGRELVDRAAAGPVTVRVKVDAYAAQDVRTKNVIAETEGGRNDRVVVVGGHLDSVFEGPGINDDGSGVSMMMETAQQIHRLGLSPRNKVRFIFFSGEEQGLLGSNYYVSQLTKKQVRNISVMLDFDMLASGNFARFVYDGDGSDFDVAGPAGSGLVEGVFSRWYDRQDLPFETTPFDGRSDYDAFTTAGIPAGGIFAGAEVVKTRKQVKLYGGTAGEPFDPCYHLRCDVLANIDRDGLREHKNAAVHAIWTFAQRETSVQGRLSGESARAKSLTGLQMVR